MEEGSEQSEMETSVRSAVRRGEPIEMLVALGRDGFLERLTLHLGRKFERLDDEDLRLIVAEVTDALYFRLAGGHHIARITSWMFKAAENMAVDLAADVKDKVVLEDWMAHARIIDHSETDEDLDRRREEMEAARVKKTNELFEIAKGLVQRIPQARPRQVMSIIFEAMAKGVTDLSNQDIGDLLGVKKGTVAVRRTARSNTWSSWRRRRAWRHSISASTTSSWRTK